MLTELKSLQVHIQADQGSMLFNNVLLPHLTELTIFLDAYPSQHQAVQFCRLFSHNAESRKIRTMADARINRKFGRTWWFRQVAKPGTENI